MLEKFSGEKRKQLFYLIGAVGGVTALMFILTSVFSESSRPKKAAVPKFEVVGKDVEAKSFRARYGDELTALKAKNKRLEEELKRLADMIEKGNSRGEAVKSPASGANALLVPPPPPPERPAKAVPVPPLPSGKPTSGEKNKASEEVLGNLIVMRSVAAPEEKGHKGARKGKKRYVIPANSFLSGYLLTGFDAPTGGKAQRHPVPVVIRIKSDAILPNGYRADIKECFMGGDAYGDLSSERAYIRLTSLSCMSKEGEAIEKKIRAYVSGEDGKVGLSGRPISKQGAILARNALAVFLEGVAKAFTANNVTYSVQPTGVVAVPKPGTVLKSGLFSGAGATAGKLSDFYMERANEIYSIIEVNAGRPVDVVLLEKIVFGEEKG